VITHRFFEWIAQCCKTLEWDIAQGSVLAEDSNWYACYDDGMTPEEAVQEWKNMGQSNAEEYEKTSTKATAPKLYAIFADREITHRVRKVETRYVTHCGLAVKRSNVKIDQVPEGFRVCKSCSKDRAYGRKTQQRIYSHINDSD